MVLLGAHHPSPFHFSLDHYLRRVDVPILGVVESLAGATCYAVSSVLQQRAAEAQPAELALRPSLLLRLAGSGRWMVGNLMDVGGFVFQFLALRQAALAVVQPLFVVGLVFALVGSALIERRRPRRSEWASSMLVVAALAVFLAVARPGPGHPRAGALGWGALFTMTALAVTAAVLLATGSARRRAFFLATGAGILYGVTAAITERTGRLLDGGVLHMLGSWSPYALAVTALVGLLLHQSAYQAGDLRLSLPVLTVLEPVVAILIGRFLFHEHIAATLLAVVGEVLSLTVMAYGVFALAQTTLVESVRSPKGG
ncbi:MAG: DMT family transporter [Acidimicrobiales bacterium]